MKKATSLVVALILLLGVGGVVTYRAARSAEIYARAGKDQVFAAKRALTETHAIGTVASDLRGAAGSFEKSSTSLRTIRYLKYIPWVGPKFKAGYATIQAASITTRALSQASTSFASAWEPFARNAHLRIGDLTSEERSAFLGQFQQSIPELRASAAALTSARDLLHHVSESDIPIYGTEVRNVKQIVDSAATLLTDALPLAEAALPLLGYPEKQTYLFLLENSDELRPTGGFIGTYGLLTFDSAHITEFFTDDIYNLDHPVPAKTRALAPVPLQKYLGVGRLYLRDANWSPHGPAALATALHLYQEERTYARNDASALPGQGSVDGVIAVTPEAIRPLLELTGPLTIQGQTFTAENITDVLEYEVEQGFAQKGVPRPQRKALVSELGHALIERVVTLPPSAWSETVHIVRRALDEKQLLLYSTHPALQKLIEGQGWAGALTATPHDYLTVIDANLFAFKTDPYVHRAISYKITKKGEVLTGETEITYSYPEAGPAWKTKDYRTWTRIYVPKGAILAQAYGAMEGDSGGKGLVTIEQEQDKTVFGGFLFVRPGETKRLRFVYRLPQEITKDIERGSYQLDVQKQAGTVGYSLTVTTDFGKVPRAWHPEGLQVARDGSRVYWKTELRQDQTFHVEF